jgi:hypothetical protein
MMDENFLSCKIGTELMYKLDPKAYYDSEVCMATIPLSGRLNMKFAKFAKKNLITIPNELTPPS